MRYIIIACLVVGCTLPPETLVLGAARGECRDLSEPVPLVIDTHWTAEEQEALLRAAESWTEAVGVEWAVGWELCEVGEWKSACTTKGWDSPSRGGFEAMPTELGVVIYTREVRRASGMSGIDYDVMLERTIAHELGHYLGADGHHIYDGVLSQPATVDSTRVTVADATMVEGCTSDQR